MAAKPVSTSVAEAVVIDWRLGRMSQREIADKHKVSKGTVGNLCKGVVQDAVEAVGKGIEYRQALQGYGGRMVGAIEDEVDERTRLINFFNDAVVTNVQQAMETPCITQHDFKARAETISKGKEVALGKTPDTAIQINNQQPVSSVERVIVRPQHSNG